MKKSIFYYLTHPCVTLSALLSKYSDRYAIEQQWKSCMDYPLDLDNPKSFCEKINWLKLHDHNPLYHKLVDKYEVKEWVAQKIGMEHVVKTYALYNSTDEIDFDALPNRFVLKCTHNSGGLVVCKDKSKLDKKQALKLLSQSMAIKDYYLNFREWAYKGVKPRIIAEEYIESLGRPESIEYKLTCINGKVRMTTVCSGIAHDDFDKRFNDHFDKDGNRLPFYVNYKPAGLDLPKPVIHKQLIDYAELLAKDIPQVRVDFYIHNNAIMFGEMTFYTWAGYMNYVPKEYDCIMGSWLKLNV